MTPVLVTGGAGYVGSHACKALRAAGFLPVTYDDLSKGRREAVRWGPLEVGDLLDAARLDAVLAAHRPAAALHFAGLIEVGESVREPERYRRVNVEGSRSLLGALRRAGVPHLVFSSTAAVYGEPVKVPITEDHPKQPVNPYGETKLAVEGLLAEAKGWGLRSIALRYFNACGADPDGETGECHDPETHLLPNMLRATAGLAPPLTVFGEDWPTPDGTCVRDYIHVADLADAHVAALVRLMRREELPPALNLGTGKGLSIRELIAAAEEVTGKAVPRSVGPRRAGDPAVLVADPSAARAALGWSATRSDVRTVVATAWEWERRGRRPR